MSDSEIDVVVGIVAGRSTAELAIELNKSEDEIRELERELLRRTCCDRRTQLAILWTLHDADSATYCSVGDLRRQLMAMTLERNAYRQHCCELKQILTYLGLSPAE